MSNEQITVRRTRHIPVAPYTYEEAEYTVTVDRREGRGILDTLNRIDNALTKLLNQKLPLTSETQPIKTVNPQSNNKPSNNKALNDTYDVLAWNQSRDTQSFADMKLSKNPTGLEKELCKEILAHNGVYKLGRTTYRLVKAQDGNQYLQRWRN